MTGNETIAITVNGQVVETRAGTLLLKVLTDLGLQVPTLCHDDLLTPYGGCRLCVVARNDGRGGLVPACSTPVQRGMVIETDTPEVIESRRGQLQLLVLNHRMECPVCLRRGDCRFQDLIYEYGVPEDPLPFELVQAPRDEKSPVIVRDPEKCIVCGKCVRLCDEVQGVAAIGIVNRGLGAHVTTMEARPLDCEFCGQCVNACPVGALVARPYVPDVPVWLRETTTTTCSFCSCACQLTVETYEGALQRVNSRAEEPPNRGKLCVKGWLGWDVHCHPERLTGPLVRREGRLEEASWDDALETMVRALREAEGNGKAVVGVGSSRLTCEDAYLMQRFLRGVVGTPHVDVGPVGGVGALVGGMSEITGTPCSTATFEEMTGADLVFVLRADPTRTHPLVKTDLVQGVRQRGQELILAHALSGGLERQASLYLPLEPASEEVLLRGVAAHLLARRPRLAETLREVPGFAEWASSLEAYAPEAVEPCTGVSPERLEELVNRLAAARTVVMVVVTGIGIPGNEVAVTRAAEALIALLGWGERRGGGVLVLGEKANVQGVLDVGLHPALLPGHRPAEVEASRREIEDVWGGPVPGEVGWTAREAFPRSVAGEVGVLYLVGQDPVAAWPRGYGGHDAVQGSGFVVVQDAFLTNTARIADVVLPVAILGEREGSLVGADGIRRRVRRALSPPARQPQDGQIFAEVARRLGRALPTGAELEGEMEGLVAWPHPKGQVRRLEPAPPPMPSPHLSGILVDASPQLFHSGSFTCRSRLLQELSPSVAVRLSPVDAAALGVKSGEVVRLATEDRELLLRARVDHTVRPGTMVTLWHDRGDSAATLMDENNQLIAVEVRRSP